MELVMFIGLQATGKSSFYKERFYRTHLRVNYDMLATRHREALIYRACIEGKAKCVIDNTNLTAEERARYILPAKAAGFEAIGYFFESRVADALARNSQRSESERVPERGILGASKKLELPSLDEGFARLFFVQLDDAGGFRVENWRI